MLGLRADPFALRIDPPPDAESSPVPLRPEARQQVAGRRLIPGSRRSLHSAQFERVSTDRQTHPFFRILRGSDLIAATQGFPARLSLEFSFNVSSRTPR